MSLVLKSENFKIFDVSGIKVEGRLAFEKNANNLVPRNEDEAFIKEFIRERGGSKIGGKKIKLWGSSEDWNSILWDIDSMHRYGWVKVEILKGKEELPDIVRPDPEKDQVDENYSYFTGYYSIERYIEDTVYKNKIDEHDEVWELPPMKDKTENKSGRIKKLEEFAAIYKDFSKMRGLWLQPKNKLKLSFSCSLRFDDIKDDSEYEQSVEKISAETTHSTEGYMEDGSLTLYDSPEVKYEDANGNERTHCFAGTIIYLEEHSYEKRIKDGKDSDGRLKYKEVNTERRVAVDIEMDATDMKFLTDDGEELEWELKAAIFMATLEVRHHDFESNKGYTSRKDFIVKADVQGMKIKVGENFRNKIMSEIPAMGGSRTRLSIQVFTFAWMGDIKWNMQIDDGGDNQGGIIVTNV